MAQTIALPKMALRGVKLYHFKHSTSLYDAAEVNCEAFGPCTVSKSISALNVTIIQWKIKIRVGRPEVIDDDALLQVIETGPMQTAREIAVQFGISHVSFINHLHSFVGDTMFENEEDVKSFLYEFIHSNPRDFWMRTFKTLPERWQNVIDNESDYRLD
ncbi:Hypothetical predicted protein [Octopus vulgaris]|uniref:Uncharacterized protein n=1 Tax=Octopus vulgaris TaxID=6645 RepID=A0AA36B4Y8_OCTVU|nr:Hypothetical predicted protein [Octopus vulgaris]